MANKVERFFQWGGGRVENGHLDKFPLLWNGRAAGELEIRREPLYTWFDARCRLPGDGLWCAWALGKGGSLRLGVLEPSGQEAVIRRRFSHRMTQPLGELIGGEIRPAAEEGRESWDSAAAPETVFQSRWLADRLRGVRGVLVKRERGGTYLALPYDCGRPFPLPTLFCFANIRSIDGARYAVYAFDEKERPVFQGDGRAAYQTGPGESAKNLSCK